MSNYAAKVENGVVVQAIVGDAKWATERLGGIWHAIDSKIGVGWTYTDKEGFRPPKPFPSWVWGDGWEPPAPYPDGGAHRWDEDSGAWVPA